MAEGLVLACAAGQAAGRTYLLVNDQPVTQREFLAAIAAELDVPVPTRRIPYGAAWCSAAQRSISGAWRGGGSRRP